MCARGFLAIHLRSRRRTSTLTSYPCAYPMQRYPLITTDLLTYPTAYTCIRNYRATHHVLSARVFHHNRHTHERFTFTQKIDPPKRLWDVVTDGGRGEVPPSNRVTADMKQGNLPPALRLPLWEAGISLPKTFTRRTCLLGVPRRGPREPSDSATGGCVALWLMPPPVSHSCAPPEPLDS